jgi:small subunit ribosomal protein S12
MPTYSQIIKTKRKLSLKKKKNRRLALAKSPQKKGTCLLVFTTAPKKPNSAMRPVAKIVLSTQKQLFCHIPGEGHTLQKHSTVLIRGCRVRDLPGMKYRAIRGKYDLKGVADRKRSRSKYGVKKP